MVASRCPYRLAFRAVAINLSISAGVKYFRALPTEEFTMVGDVPPFRSSGNSVATAPGEIAVVRILYGAGPAQDR